MRSDIPTFLRSFSESWQTVFGQTEYIQTLSNQILKRGELATPEFRPRFVASWLRVKWLLLTAATDVSVIVPTWNEEKYLEKCLKSLRRQSLKDPFEVIVVDGGSSDHTLEIAHKFAHEVLVVPDRPVGAARNIGAAHAKGNILAFIDADTAASKNWLEQTVKTFNAHPEAVCVTGPTLPYEGSRLDELMYEIATGWAQRVSFRLGFPHVAGFNCAYRKDAFWSAGGFDENRELSEDVVLSLKIRRHGIILFNDEMIAYTSLRRTKEFGYPYMTTYYALNAMTLLLFGRTMAYPKIR
jgi:glycosyltransferase involved in cell wall biosynthesis